MTKNLIFREFYCGLSIEEAAELCFKSVTTIKGWDRGKPIPKECKRLMRLYSNRELGTTKEWIGFYIESGKLVLPTGQRLTANQVMIGAALVEIGSDFDRMTSSSVIRIARLISKNGYLEK